MNEWMYLSKWIFPDNPNDWDIMSYAPMNYTAISGNYPLPYPESTLQNQQGTLLLKKHKCKFCNYTSDQSNNVTRHALKKHPGMNNKNVQSYGLPMGIENAGVVYQQNYQPQWMNEWMNKMVLFIHAWMNEWMNEQDQPSILK